MYIRFPGSECHIDSVAIGTSVQHGSLTLLLEYQRRPAGRAAARQAQGEREGKEERRTTLNNRVETRQGSDSASPPFPAHQLGSQF